MLKDIKEFLETIDCDKVEFRLIGGYELHITLTKNRNWKEIKLTKFTTELALNVSSEKEMFDNLRKEWNDILEKKSTGYQSPLKSSSTEHELNIISYPVNDNIPDPEATEGWKEIKE